MSRTDAHRPYWVWIADEPQLVGVYHDHARAACSLGDPHVPEADPAGPCCRMPYVWARRCNCSLCGTPQWRDEDNGARRTAERALTRAAARGAGEVELEWLAGVLYSRSRH